MSLFKFLFRRRRRPVEPPLQLDESQQRFLAQLSALTMIALLMKRP